jgi:hypothetical protein
MHSGPRATGTPFDRFKTTGENIICIVVSIFAMLKGKTSTRLK